MKINLETLMNLGVCKPALYSFINIYGSDNQIDIDILIKVLQRSNHNWLEQLCEKVKIVVVPDLKVMTAHIPKGLIDVFLKKCDNLQSIILPEGVQNAYLAECINLATIVLPKGMETVFLRDCTSLKSITFPKDMKYADLGGCTSLTSISCVPGGKLPRIMGLSETQR